MRILYTAVLAAILSTHSLAAVAASPMQAMLTSRTSTMYAVSGIVRSNADGNVIKLVQGIHLAISSDEAVGSFSREVLARYPGYSLMDTVATALPPTKSLCGQSI